MGWYQPASVWASDVALFLRRPLLVDAESATGGQNLFSGSTGLEPADAFSHHLQLSQKVWKSMRTGTCVASCTSAPGHVHITQGVGE